ncbi:hypothetical protein C8R47DRAFT_590155 [Mycena vitilis]|nr:hypothetical protein C8R47DRAFT_590155 [Mycena vitilis]
MMSRAFCPALGLLLFLLVILFIFLLELLVVVLASLFVLRFTLPRMSSSYLSVVDLMKISVVCTHVAAAEAVTAFRIWYGNWPWEGNLEGAEEPEGDEIAGADRTVGFFDSQHEFDKDAAPIA